MAHGANRVHREIESPLLSLRSLCEKNIAHRGHGEFETNLFYSLFPLIKIIFLILKIDLRSAVAEAGMILVNEGLYLVFCFKDIMDLITQFAAANAMHYYKIR